MPHLNEGFKHTKERKIHHVNTGINKALGIAMESFIALGSILIPAIAFGYGLLCLAKNEPLYGFSYLTSAIATALLATETVPKSVRKISR